MSFDDRYAPLLARRVRREDVIIGRAYLIHARNGGVGVAVEESDHLGYRLHREKFGQHFLFVEWDWDEGPPYGTAIPLSLLPDEPPDDDAVLLDWLAERETEHQDAVGAAWDVILGRQLDEAERVMRDDRDVLRKLAE